MKKEFEHKPKSSPRHKGEDSVGCCRRNWFSKDHLSLSLSMNVLLSHRDSLKRLVFKLHTFCAIRPPNLPSSIPICRLAHNAGKGWVRVRAPWFFLNIVLCGARDTARYQSELHQAGCRQCSRKKYLFVFRCSLIFPYM